VPITLLAASSQLTPVALPTWLDGKSHSFLHSIVD
jgi:hypothetical protein